MDYHNPLVCKFDSFAGANDFQIIIGFLCHRYVTTSFGRTKINLPLCFCMAINLGKAKWGWHLAVCGIGNCKDGQFHLFSDLKTQKRHFASHDQAFRHVLMTFTQKRLYGFVRFLFLLLLVLYFVSSQISPSAHNIFFLKINLSYKSTKDLACHWSIWIFFPWRLSVHETSGQPVCVMCGG